MRGGSKHEVVQGYSISLLKLYAEGKSETLVVAKVRRRPT